MTAGFTLGVTISKLSTQEISVRGWAEVLYNWRNPLLMRASSAVFAWPALHMEEVNSRKIANLTDDLIGKVLTEYSERKMRYG